MIGVHDQSYSRVRVCWYFTRTHAPVQFGILIYCIISIIKYVKWYNLYNISWHVILRHSCVKWYNLYNIYMLSHMYTLHNVCVYKQTSKCKSVVFPSLYLSHAHVLYTMCCHSSWWGHLHCLGTNWVRHSNVTCKRICAYISSKRKQTLFKI